MDLIVLLVILAIILFIVITPFILLYINRDYIIECISDFFNIARHKFSSASKNIFTNTIRLVTLGLVKIKDDSHFQNKFNVNEYRIVNDRLMLFRMSFDENKLNIFSKDIRIDYINSLAYYLRDLDLSENNTLYLFLKSYAEHIGVNDINTNNSYIKSIYKIHKTNEKKKLFLFIKRNEIYRLKMLFLFELFFIRYLVCMSSKNINNNMNIESDIDFLIENLYLHESESSLIISFLNILNKSNINEIYTKTKELILSSSNKHLIDLSENLLNNIKIISNYMSLPIYNVGIFATMSAGKSTFLNALLDKDFIPSRNEACTAKITSISDNDSMNYKIFGGCSLDNRENYLFSNNITDEVLENWNNDNRIDHIFLETDIKYIHSKNGILVIHDTPGPNNSRSEEHGLITKEFLENKKDIDLYIYLINAEHSTADDNFEFMTKVYKSFSQRVNAKIIFLLNKIDSFDTDKSDNINNSINNVKLEIEKAGFKNPMIIPISANAARLFKKALHNESMTRKEIKDFYNLFYLFNENKVMDLPSYCSEEILEMSYNKGYSLKEDLESEDIINVNGENYNKKYLLRALDKTSINLVRSLIDKEINK